MARCGDHLSLFAAPASLEKDFDIATDTYEEVANKIRASTPYVVLDLPHRAPSAGAIASVVVLGLVCTALAFVIFSVLIHEAGTGRAMVITYINPVVAVALGVALLGEQPGAGAVAGLLLILAGSWLSTGGGLPPPLRKLAERVPRAQRRAEGTIANTIAFAVRRSS